MRGCDEGQCPPAPAFADAATDEALMELISQDDALALHQLMRRYWESVVTYTRRLVGGDPDSAADIAQQVFIRLWQARKRWRPSGTVRAFIFRIAQNAASNERRACCARSRLDENCRRDPNHPPWTPLQSLEEKELREALTAALGRLPPRRREVYRLARDHDLSYLEISTVMGISPQTVANQMSAAVADLRRHLSAVLDER